MKFLRTAPTIGELRRTRWGSNSSNTPLFPIMASIFLLGASTPVLGNAARTQTFQIEAGWNAIYLAVEPNDPFPATVFTNCPVDIAATYDGVFSPRQFSSDPSANMLSLLGWGVWYSPARSDWFLSDLSAIHGQKPYLVHATTAFSLEIEGEVEIPQTRWQPNAYNLVGFCLDGLAPPTFSQFFAGSAAHADCNAYRMVGGTWRKVLEPENEAMRSGEAFWIFCNGTSTYQGPLRVETSSFRGVLLDVSGDEIVVHNETTHPLGAEISHVVAGNSGLPMAVVVEIIGEEVGMKPIKIPMTNAAWTVTLPPLEAGDGIRIPLALQMEEMSQPKAHALLCIKTDIGTETWLPVQGTRENLK